MPWETDRLRHVLGAAVVALALLVSTGCGNDDRPLIQQAANTTAQPTSTAVDTTTTPPDPPFLNHVAVTNPGVGTVDVAAAPAGPIATQVANPNEHGVNSVFLMVAGSTVTIGTDGTEWYHVLLPVKPNGSSGYVSSRQVTLESNTVRLVVRRAGHQLDYERDGVVVATYPIAVGKIGTETPTGRYFIKELLEPTNADGAYGPYAYGLSGFSNSVLSADFGDGVIGIHGTNDPSKIGGDVSHGCIRLKNSDITALVDAQLPLGTPVDVLD